MTDNHDSNDDNKGQLRTIRDAQKFLRVGRTTIYKLAEQGLLELVKIGAGTRVTQRSLDAYVNGAKRIEPKNPETKNR